MTPDALNRLVAQLSKLPGIGEKTAQRLAFHVLRSPPDYARGLAEFRVIEFRASQRAGDLPAWLE